MRQNRLLVLGLIMLILFLVVTFVGPHIPYVKNSVEDASRVRFVENNAILTAPFTPSQQFPFGSDREGRDLLSALIVGAKDTLFMILAICLIRYVLAIPLGLLASRGRGFFSWLLTGWNRIFSSVPTLFSAMLFLNIPILIMSSNRLYWSILILALIEVGKAGFVVQEETRAIAKKPYVEAGVTVGVPPNKLLKNHILPNIFPAVVVNFSIDIGRTALLIGQMGIFSIFISQVFVQTSAGVGEMVNTSLNWLTLLGQLREDMLKAFWIPFYTCVAITYVIFTFNIVGEGLRRHFDRRTA